MNILIVSYLYPSSSDLRLGLFVHEQAKELAFQGHEVRVITIGSAQKEEEKEGVKIIRIASNGAFSGLKFLFRARRYALDSAWKVDVIHLHFIGLNALFFKSVTRRKGIPLVATAHGMDVCPRNFFERAVLRFSLPRIDHIMAVSHFTRSLVLDIDSQAKVSVAQNGVDLKKLQFGKEKELREKLGLKNKKIILSIGGLVERKGYDVMIRGLPMILKEIPNTIHLIIGRGGDEEKFRRIAKELGVSDYVQFLGYVPDSKISNYYALCDVFALMSRTIKEEGGIEGFGIVYAEASAMGKPVIGGKSGGTADSIVDGKSGFRIDPLDSSAYAKKMVLLLSDSSLRKKMGGFGRKWVRSSLLWKHNASKTLKVYDEAILSCK